MTPPQNLFPFILCFSLLLPRLSFSLLCLLSYSLSSAFHDFTLFNYLFIIYFSSPIVHIPHPLLRTSLLSAPLLLSSPTADRPDPAWWWHFTHADPSQITSPCGSQSQGQGQGCCWRERGGRGGCTEASKMALVIIIIHCLLVLLSCASSHSSCFFVLLMSGPHGTRISWAQDGWSQRGQVADAWLILLRLKSARVSSCNGNSQIETNTHAFWKAHVHRIDCTKYDCADCRSSMI